MNRQLKTLIVAVGIALASGVSSVAGADDGGGDNSMSRWMGDSYKSFEEARGATVTASESPTLTPSIPTNACDNGMSQFCGDSYAAFRQGLLGDFYTERDERARSGQATGHAPRVANASALKWGVGRAFRDDTAG